MCDLETLGRRPGCTILSIGAVKFSISNAALGGTFYVNIDPKTCAAAGLVNDPETVAWWKKQSQQAKDSLLTNRVPLRTALEQFTAWLEDCGPLKERKVWGNGPSFDNAILGHAYMVCGMPQPWPFWGDRCFRTIKGMYSTVPMVTRPGVHHNALDDAVHQAQHILNIKTVTSAKRRPAATDNQITAL
jgi:hypothetical protein